MSDLTPERETEIRNFEQAATPGPWCTDSWEIYQGTEYVAGAEWIGETCRGATTAAQDRADAAFVAAARSAVPELLAEVKRIRAELAAAKAGMQLLVDGWKQASNEHASFAKSNVMNEYPGLADKQEGRSLQLLDCADELADVVKGEDPDDWEYGIGVDVTNRDERTPTP